MTKYNRNRSGCVDVYHAYLVENAVYAGEWELPRLCSEHQIPNRLIPFSKAIGSTDTNAWVHFSVERLDNGNFIMRMEKPGNVPGSKAIYYKVVDRNGILIRAYKETFDPKGNLVHTKEK